jgi:hypothetical protein
MAKAAKDVRVEDLSPAAQQAVDAKHVAGRRKVKDWIGLIKELAEFDAVSDQLQKRASNFMILGIVVLIAGAIGFAVAASHGGGFLSVLCALLGVAGIALAVYHGLRWSRFKKVDLANDFRACVPPLLDVLAEDMEDKAKVKMELDMAGIGKSKQVKKGKIDPGRFRKVIETIYQDPWCSLTAPLVDGSQAVLNIENQFIAHERHWTKRSRSGKIKFKSKTKWKKLVHVSAAIVPNAENFEWDDAAVDARAAEEKLKMAEKKGCRVCRLVRKFKFSDVNKQPDGVVPAEEIVGMFMHLFSMLAPAEARS